MEITELQQIKARAEQVKKLLGDGSDTLRLIEEDLPKLTAEVERLRRELEEGRCPHGGFYKERTCVECFGDGTEEMQQCKPCKSKTWHRGGKCVRHDASAPKPYDQLRTQLKQLQGEIQTTQERFSAQLAETEQRAKKFESEAGELRQELKPHEEVKGRVKQLEAEIETVQEQSSSRVEAAEGRAKKFENEIEKLRKETAPQEQLKIQLQQLQDEMKTVQQRASVRAEEAEGRAKKFEAEARQLREELKPVERLKGEIKQLQEAVEKVQERSSARVAKAEARAKEIEAAAVAMREALEYVKVRLGSSNLGESLIKIDQALSATAPDWTADGKKGNTAA
jgi:myosin heavy subunit